MSQESPYKHTVLLPQTEFPIRAGLAELEPKLLEKWQAQNLYFKRLETPKKKGSYVLHDGPPYPNGNIHMGHALNKVLKDIIVRYKTMNGYHAPYIPGWDCHGLPIETQVIKELKANGEEHKKQDIPWFRNRCKEFALSYVETQKNDFKRLGILGDWNHPYLTLDPTYEAAVIEQFGQLAENNLVERGRKPIHWCMHCETALAEAEIEYAPHRSPSIYIAFTIETASEKLKAILNQKQAAILVWTTTPWTLPANVAIAAHPDLNYVVFSTSKGVFIVAEALLEKVTATLEFETLEQLGTLTGTDLTGTQTQHPFINRLSPVLTGTHVTSEDGTGFVHTAPGHGQDDYIMSLTYNLPIIMPVDEKGRFTAEVEHWAGQFVFDANKAIGQTLEANQKLLKLQFISHSYPHCWRCKNPVIFRATEQWFIKLDKEIPSTQKTLRETALENIEATDWMPDWGKNRIRSMVENRPDWCVSRQRFWGIPIPAFICTTCGHAELTGEFSKAIITLIKKEGTMAWFEKPVSEILPSSLTCSNCKNHAFKKETDILDVWFESGASFLPVVKNGLDQEKADLYLEGSDQHRGWFQSSLLIGCGTQGTAPYKRVLTHGFLVDDKGRKMSKSVGNVLAPEKIVKEYGADILRWWVASTDFKNDVAISPAILNQARDSFSKVRNTIRFCLSNLFDFDPTTTPPLETLDNAILEDLNEHIDQINFAFSDTAFDLHIATYLIQKFCTVELSSIYFDIIKDRLYCDDQNSSRRRSAQATLFKLADTLIRLIAPVLPFTAEAAYNHLLKPDKKESIHLEPFPEAPLHDENHEKQLKKWKQVQTIRSKVYQQLEHLRASKTIKSFLEAKVYLTLDQEMENIDWPSILIVSQVELSQGPTLEIRAEKIEGEKCERCWKILPLSPRALCTRCETVVP